MSVTRRSVEARGKNVEDAVQKGLAQLGVRRDQVDIFVITEGSRGILGIGAEDARVRLTVLAPPEPPPPPVQAPPVVETPRPVPVERPTPPPPVPTPPVVETPRPATVEPPAPAAPPPTPEPAVDAVRAPAAAPVAAPPVAPSPAIEKLAADTVREILAHMGYRVSVTSRQSPAEEGDDGPAYLVDVRGTDMNALTGRRGEALDALQYLTRLIIQHKTGQWASIVVDVEGFREKRSQTLRQMAEQMAERVKRDGRSIALEPMPPYERRIIHLALRNHPAVMTVSVGEGDARKVTIRPKK